MSEKLYTAEQMREAWEHGFTPDPNQEEYFSRFMSATIPTAQSPVVPTHNELDRWLWQNVPRWRSESDCRAIAGELRAHLLTLGHREESSVCPECGHKVSMSHEGVCNNQWHSRATPPPINVREAVEQIKIADKLVRFDSDEPQWVTMMKVLEALQKALALLSAEVGK
jgi:hypothetical protein